jgi:hypothetical protein
MSPAAAETVGDVIAYLDHDVLSGVEPTWPPDVFAIAATLLKRSGAYREVANAWPPKNFTTTSEWHDAIMASADEWRASCDSDAAIMPARARDWWATVLAHAAMPLDRVLDDQSMFVALVGLVAITDFSCRGFGFTNVRDPSVKEDRANLALESHKTLCENIHPSRCVVLPKAHNPYTGMTLRSLTHNLALWDRPEVTASWDYIRLDDVPTGSMNLLILPWPLTIQPTAFHPAENCYDLHLPDRVELFEYDIAFTYADVANAIDALQAARDAVDGEIHAIVFPELAMSPTFFATVREKLQQACKIPLLIAGIGGPNDSRLGTNNVAISTNAELEPYQQGKHHRWRIDEYQASNYGLLGELPPKKDNGGWWEAIEIVSRTCFFFNMNNWLTFCALICEDLARLDPVSELVRSVGPGLVIALLLDGGQVRGRWPDRYAAVLAEDPRSSVLTLTAVGLVDLAIQARNGNGKRSVALWKEAFLPGGREIELEAGSRGIVLRLESKQSQEWTADGRHDDGTTTYLSLVKPPVQVR